MNIIYKCDGNLDRYLLGRGENIQDISFPYIDHYDDIWIDKDCYLTEELPISTVEETAEKYIASKKEHKLYYTLIKLKNL